MMRGDAEALHARGRDQGLQVELQLYPVDAHAFQLFCPRVTRH